MVGTQVCSGLSFHNIRKRSDNACALTGERSDNACALTGERRFSQTSIIRGRVFTLIRLWSSIRPVRVQLRSLLRRPHPERLGVVERMGVFREPPEPGHLEAVLRRELRVFQRAFVHLAHPRRLHTQGFIQLACARAHLRANPPV